MKKVALNNKAPKVIINTNALFFSIVTLKNPGGPLLIKKLNVIAIILLIVFGGFLGIFNFESELVCAVGNTFYVGGSGLGNYSSIQAAIDDASSGDSIFVYDGVYYGNIVINKTLNLIGQNRDTTIINGDGAEKVIKIIADEVILKGFTITNGGYGIYSWDGSYNMIYNNNISNNWYGLDLKQFSRSEIIANKISMNTYYGIYIDGYSDHNTIEANNISENQYGIFFDVTPSFNTIKRNNVITNYYGITFTRSSNNKIAFNNISSNEKHGIKISASSNNEIMYNNISLNNYGIYLDHSFNNEIKYNDISYNNEYGIRAQYSSINITGNEILMNNYIGLRFDYSIYNNVTGNNFVNGGIYMRGGKLSHYNTHNINLNNKVNGQPLHYYNDSNNINIDGLSVGQLIIVNCNEGTVENLEINNTSVAIIIAYSSKINIKNNILTNNGYGIKLDYSSKNCIYNNYFIENVHQSYDETNANIWNETYPVGGNYWSNYSPGCADLCDGAKTPQWYGSPDGICDNQYNIQGISTDYYPLKYSWVLTPPHMPTALNATAGNSYVNLTWNAPYNDGGSLITNYRIYRSTKIDNMTLIFETGNVLYYNDTNVTNGVNYYYGVTAKNVIGEGQLSELFTALPASVPTTPRNLSAVPGDFYINITWVIPLSIGGFPITSYTIYRGITPDELTLLSDVGNVTYYYDNNAINGICYFYRISAKNIIGEGSLSNLINTTPGVIPTTPRGLVAIAGDSYINISWNDPLYSGGPQITNYHIYKRFAPAEINFLIEIKNLLYYNDTNVTNGITYFYRVSAVNEIGEGPLSYEVNATPFITINQLPVCTIDTPMLNISVSKTYELSGTATDPDGIVQMVQIKIDDGDWFNITGTTTWSFNWDTTAESNGYHIIYIRAFDSANFSLEETINVTVNNPEKPESSILDELWLWGLIIIIIVMIIILILINIVLKLKTRRTQPPPNSGTKEH